MSVVNKLPSDILAIRWLPRLVEASMVLLMAWVVAGGMAGGTRGTASSTDRRQPASMQATPSVKSIIAIPLFGKVTKKVAKPVPPVAVISRLRLRLLGTMLAGAHSAAIIMREHGTEQKMVFLNDNIQPGVLLKRVEALAIVVDNHGRQERILMKKSVLAGAAVVLPQNHGGIQHLSRAVVDAQLNNLSALLTQAKATPHQMNGKPDGFMIQEIVPGSLYDQAGLKNGDVIRKVNGQPITRPEQGIQLFQSLKRASGIDLEIARAGAVHTVHFDIR